MTKTKALIALLLVLLFLFSFHGIAPFKRRVLSFANEIKSEYLRTTTAVRERITLYMHQKEQIEALREELRRLKPVAALSVAFASELNGCLKEMNLSAYRPRLIPVRALSYRDIEDPGKIWLDFPGFEHNRTYGLIFRGYSAGIVREEEGQPLAILQSDKEALFAVEIGKEKIPAVVFGDGKGMVVKYIPLYKHPKVGDEVVTSGKDGLFFEGIKVGRISHIMTRKIYKSARVEPYAKLVDPHFFYAVAVK